MKDKKLLWILASQKTLDEKSAALLSLGYSASDLDEWDSIPVIEKPYTKIWKDIQDNKRIHNQSDFGPCDPSLNVCETAMCTAGHLVNLAGPIGYELQKKYDWTGAAHLIHAKSTSADLPEQDYGNIAQERALAFLKVNAEMENQ